MKHFVAAFLILCSIATLAQEPSRIKVYRSTEVDTKPNLKDGMYTLSQFIGEHFAFPENIANKQVKIFTSFIVEADGSMSEVKSFYISVKDLVPEDVVQIKTEQQKAEEQAKYSQMQAEAGRVLSLFKEKWIPAKIDGTPVRCLYNYPVSFNLE